MCATVCVFMCTWRMASGRQVFVNGARRHVWLRRFCCVVLTRSLRPTRPSGDASVECEHMNDSGCVSGMDCATYSTWKSGDQSAMILWFGLLGKVRIHGSIEYVTFKIVYFFKLNSSYFDLVLYRTIFVFFRNFPH